MAEQSAGPARQHRREAFAVKWQVRVAYCVDAAVQAMQTASGLRSRHGAPGIAERTSQLTDRDDPVLAIREVS